MTLSRFRVAAIILIGFNVIGTLLTWIAHLQKPGTSLTNAIGGGTQFTGPIILIAIGCVAFGMTFAHRPIIATVGVALLCLWGLGFAVGETSELFQHNVGVSPDKWHVIIVGAVIGLLIGLSCAFSGMPTLRPSRRATRVIW
jgi:hypothetical protein